ncbi:MAG: alpha/beta hydrolase [candidate division Zixibacteria bacterium]|nr:alpha/beta hydrolase [candidate division Zixibacteria bacterium]
MSVFLFHDLELHYERSGEGDFALVFIHGLGGNSESWKYQREFFRQNYDIITVDRFGHGRSSSDIDPVFAARTDAEAIDALMRSVIQKPFFAVGHSFASAILPEMIKLENPLLKGVVFVDCVYQGCDDIIDTRVTFGSTMLEYDDERLKIKADAWYSELIGPAEPEQTDLILSSFQRTDYRWMFHAVAGCREYNEKYPAAITPIIESLPILVCEAEHGTGDSFRKSWINHFKDAHYYLFDNAHHFFFITESEKFNRILEDFITQHTP